MQRLTGSAPQRISDPYVANGRMGELDGQRITNSNIAHGVVIGAKSEEIATTADDISGVKLLIESEDANPGA